MQEDKSRKK